MCHSCIMFHVSSSQRRALIGRVGALSSQPGRSAGATRAGSGGARNDPSQAMLRSGHGAAFLLTPAQGMLQPFSEQIIEITGYSDMWGEYTDTLHCRVRNIVVFLRFHTTRAQKHW